MSASRNALDGVVEAFNSAVGEGYVSVVVALALGYLFAAVCVFRQPSPFRSRVGGGKDGARSEAAGREADADDDYPAPMPKGDMTVGELRRYDGSDPNLPVLVAAKKRIYDVTRGRDYYGKGGPYNCFAGIDCSRALAKVSLDAKVGLAAAAQGNDRDATREHA